MRAGGAVQAPLISCSASGKALAENLRRWWQGFSLPPIRCSFDKWDGMAYNTSSSLIREFKERSGKQ